MASQIQQGLILRYHISFKAITSDNNEISLCNILKMCDKILKIQGNHALQDLKDLTVKQKNIKSFNGAKLGSDIASS